MGLGRRAYILELISVITIVCPETNDPLAFLHVRYTTRLSSIHLLPHFFLFQSTTKDHEKLIGYLLGIEQHTPL
jgi:hypothetical protein